MHIFSVPEGTKEIYTDKDTEIEKHISQYEPLGKMVIPSSILSVLLLILMSFIKIGYLWYSIFGYLYTNSRGFYFYNNSMFKSLY